MPPDLPNEQELILKKRARRRLVGAIALVLLMVIVLPRVLQDRVALTQQEAIRITMPNAVTDQAGMDQKIEPALDKAPVESHVSQNADPSTNLEPKVESVIASKEPEPKKNELKNLAPKVSQATVKQEKKAQVKPEAKADDASGDAGVKAAEAKAVEPKAQESKVQEPKTQESRKTEKQTENFTVQVGVYSDTVNVKRLQDQLKQAGFSTATEKVTTSKGESIRLKAGSFTSRQDAVNAMARLKEIGLPGMVIGSE